MERNRKKAGTVLRRLERLARSRVNDAVRLAYLSEEDIEGLKQLDLEALTEFKRNANGTVEIKLADRAAILERVYRLLKEDGQEADGTALLRALAEDEPPC